MEVERVWQIRILSVLAACVPTFVLC